MTYRDYIKETYNNCKSVLSECSTGELLDLEHIKRLLWGDDRVTGVNNGKCVSVTVPVSENIKDLLFDNEFLKDFNAQSLNMQRIMSQGPEAIDVTARSLALSHINVVELVEKERKLRSEKSMQAKMRTHRV